MEQLRARRHAFRATARGLLGACLARRPLVYRGAAAMPRRSLRHDREGLSTTEYVILLVIVACASIAGWRLLGTSAYSRATTATGDMGALGTAGDGAGGRGQGGGGSSSGSAAGAGAPRSRLDEATADATPPPDPKDELVMPFTLLGGALLLLIAMIVSRRNQKGDGGSGDGAPKDG